MFSTALNLLMYSLAGNGNFARKNYISQPLPSNAILVPRGRAPFGQHQELRHRPLARSNTGSSRFTDFLSLCACLELSLTNLICSGLNLLCLQSHSNRNAVGRSQRSRFLVLTKRSTASGDENSIGGKGCDI